jgi:hypothetical protein
MVKDLERHMGVSNEASRLNSNASFYLLSSLNGGVLYFFRFYTAILLFDCLPLSYYPALMLVQGLSILALNAGLWKKSENVLSENISFALIYGAGAATFIACELNRSLLSTSPMLAASVFILINLISTQLETRSSTLISTKISLLKDPRVSTKIALFEEVGGTFIAVTILWLTRYHKNLSADLIFALAFVGMALVTSWRVLARKSQHLEGESKESKTQPLFLYPFVPSMISMFSIILGVKLLMGFGSFVGVAQIKAELGGSVKEIFPFLSLTQTVLTFCVLTYSLFSERIPNWNSGFRAYLIFQSVALVGMVIWPNPFFMVGLDILRKTFQRTFLAESNQLLKANIPKSVRERISHLMDRWGNLAAYSILAGTSYLILQAQVNQRFLWAIALAICVFGFFNRKKLFERLSEYQIANLVKTNVFDVVHSCQSLAHKDARHFSGALITLLHRETEPFLLKSIIFSLSRMGAKDCIPHLIKVYETNNREDVQLAVIKGLLKFKSHEVDYFLLNALEKTIQEQTALGEMRRSIFQAITHRLKDVSIPVLLGMLKRNPSDDRIIANVLIVMGEIAKERRDDDLLMVLSQYCDPKYSRRVRVNALLFIYGVKKYYKIAFDCFSSLVTSKDDFDKGAVSFLAGELKLHGLTPFVLERSEQFAHQNSTLLVALLKLNYDKAPELLANYINHQNPTQVQVCLNQLNGLESRLRYRVYDVFFILHPEKISNLIHLLVKSNRDFEEDVKAIWSEAIRLGIEVKRFESNETTALKAA